MNSMMRKCGAVLLALFVLFFEATTVMASNDNQSGTTENLIYEVLARSNMRAEPSLDGAWVMTIPVGALVQRLDSGNTEFCQIVYEGTTGYIYSGCLKRVTDEQVITQFLGQSSGTTSNIASAMSGDVQAATGTGSNSVAGVQFSTGTLTQTTGQSSDILRVEVLTNANLRGLPSVEGRKIMSVPRGAQVVYLDEGENGYSHVSYQGQSGYVYNRCLNLDSDMINQNSGISQSVTTSEVHSASDSASGGTSSSASSASIVMQRGSSLPVSIATQITVETTEVAASNVVEIQTITTTVQAGTAAASVTGITPEDISYEIRSRANMRQSPSQDASLVTVIPVGANVVSIGESRDGYTMVQYDGIVGYVWDNCLADSSAPPMLGTEPILFTVTAYCSCRICCGNYSPEVTGRESHTATGTVPQEGRTIAVDPQVIPYGSRVYVDGMGVYVAEDCGGGIKENHIDIYFESHQAALNFGTKRLYVSIAE